MKKQLNKIIFSLILLLAISLRVYQVDTLLPPYWEEIALGYDAFSISQTANDHHGNFMPIVAFESFGDWKPSFYFYSIVPFIKIVGLNTLAVRLPSILAGLSITIGVWLLIKLILPKQVLNNKPYLPLLGMFVTAISPWAVMFSRAAWEVNLSTSLILWGIICFIKFIKTSQTNYSLLACSILLLALSMYTYHSTRIIAPVMGMMLIALWFSNTNKSSKFISNFQTFVNKNANTLLISTFVTGLLLSPLLINLTSNTTTQRFKQTSIFSDISIIEESNQGQLAQNNIIGKIFYHRYILFGREIMVNYLNHFNLNFLFISGDSNPRHSSQYFGQLYHIELVYLILGVIFVLATLRKIKNDPYPREYKNYLWFLIGWLLIGIFPASITKATPHALRILPTLPVFIIFITLGIGLFIDEVQKLLAKIKIRHKRLPNIILSSIIIFYLLELAVFWRNYTLIYPIQYANQWQSGYQEMVNTLAEYNDGTIPLYITREQGRPAMYYWFYTKTDPSLVQQWDKTAKMDQGEYLEFKNIKFVNSLQEVTATPAFVVGSEEQVNKIELDKNTELTVLNSIKDLSNKTIWVIGKINEKDIY
ncbi:MAG: glycosyltransferase family 39 protein [Candidatus Pacebacteria bacterium]|nr:glycosyltransferase family 39 protein [Candidatus Paceibacterota bacterium]